MEQIQKIDRRKLRPVTKTERMRLDPTQAKRVEQMPGKSTRGYKVFVFDCAAECGNEIRVSYGQLYTATGKCAVCVQRKRPYHALFSCMKASARSRGLSVDMDYEAYLGFVGQPCHYCDSPIEWAMWSSGGSGGTQAYNLDRKDNALGYSADNCVPCCTACNFIRRDELSYEEMLMLKPGLMAIMKRRRKEFA